MALMTQAPEPSMLDVQPTLPPVSPKLDEQVLSLDATEDDIEYRIRRGSRIVYGNVLSSDLIPKDDITWHFGILRALRKLPRWNEQWATLTIRKLPDGGIESKPNQFAPHRLEPDCL